MIGQLGEVVFLLTSDWLKLYTAAVKVVRPVSVCYKEVLPAQLFGKWRAGVSEQ